MAIFKITGYREYSFADGDTGELREGMSVFYETELNGRSGMAAAGYCTEKVNVETGTELYNKMKREFKEPVEGDIKYELLPGRKRPVLVDIEF